MMSLLILYSLCTSDGVSRLPGDDLSSMNFEGWNEVLAQPETEEYQQPDLSFFPELEDDWQLAWGGPILISCPIC